MLGVTRYFLKSFFVICLLLCNLFSYAQYTFEAVLNKPSPFVGATGVTIDNDGKIYVADSQEDKVIVFNADRSFGFAIGSTGSGNGQFNNPEAVAVDDTNDFIYVSDRLNFRVQKFTKEGTFIGIIGGRDVSGNGSMDGMFSLTSGIDVDSEGNLYVCDSRKVQKFNSAGIFLAKIIEIEQPSDIAVDHNGDLFISHWSSQRILKITSSGAILETIAGYCNGIAVDNAGQVLVTVFVSACCQYEIRKFTNNLTFIHAYGTAGTAPGELASPRDVMIDANGYLFIADMSRVQIFKPYGTPEISVSYKNEQIEINDNHSFGSTTYGKPVDRTFEISNILGAGELLLREFSLPDGFTLIGTFPQTLNPNRKESFTVRMPASAVGHFNGLVKFKTNDPDEPEWEFAIDGVVERALQTITIDKIPDKTYGDGPFKIEGTNSSGLPFTFSIEGFASIDANNFITITGTGPVIIRGSHAGTENYLPASSLSSFSVLRAPQAISFDSISDHNIGESPITLSASATSGLPVSFRVNAGPATMIGPNRLSFYRDGSITIEAMQEGNQNYLPAIPKQRYFETYLILGSEDVSINGVTIYPNPAAKTTVIKSAHGFSQIVLCDMTGREIMSFQSTGAEDILDVSNLASGIYTLNCKVGNQTFMQRLVISQ